MIDIFAQLLIAVIAGVGAGFGVYGAIRADLARAIATAENAAANATRAHERLDNHLARGQ